MALMAALVVPSSGMAEVHSSIADVELLAGWRSANGKHVAAIQIELEPGWKTYWRAPGDAGIPPIFEWVTTENVSEIAVAFPVPQVFDQNGLRSVGYEDTVIFPLVVTPKDKASNITLSGRVIVGVCEDVCVPLAVKVSAVLPVSIVKQTESISAAMANRPMSAREAGVKNAKCKIKPISDGMQLNASVTMPSLGSDEFAVIEMRDRSIWVSEADVSRNGNTLSATVDLVPQNAQPFASSRQDVRITILGDGQAVDIQGCS